MERRARIELATRTWKDRVIPFYERRVLLIIQQTSLFVYLFGRGDEIRTHDTDFKDQCLRPLGDTPTELVARARIELAIIAYQATVIPFNYPAKNLVVIVGLEPTIGCV